MSDPSNHRSNGHASSRRLTLWQISSRDAVAFTARLLIIMTWLMMAVIVISMLVGEQRPRETPGEIALGMALITAALLTVIVTRRNTLSRGLNAWTPVPAKIYHSAHVQFFITVGLLYEWRGRELKRTIQVPAGKATRFLVDRKEVTVLLDPERPGRVVIGEIYKEKQNLDSRV